MKIYYDKTFGCYRSIPSDALEQMRRDNEAIRKLKAERDGTSQD